MNTDYKKPPLAPKPKFLGHLTSVAVSKLPSSLVSKQGFLSSPNSTARGPKPPIAPKPKLPSSSEEEASTVHENNNINRCTNGSLIYSDDEMNEENQCNSKCSDCDALDLSDEDEYIVVPEVQLTDGGSDEFDNEGRLCFELSSDILKSTDYVDGDGEESVSRPQDEDDGPTKPFEVGDSEMKEAVEQEEQDSLEFTELADNEFTDTAESPNHAFSESEGLISSFTDEAMDYKDNVEESDNCCSVEGNEDSGGEQELGDVTTDSVIETDNIVNDQATDCGVCDFVVDISLEISPVYEEQRDGENEDHCDTTESQEPFVGDEVLPNEQTEDEPEVELFDMDQALENSNALEDPPSLEVLPNADVTDNSDVAVEDETDSNNPEAECSISVSSADSGSHLGIQTEVCNEEEPSEMESNDFPHLEDQERVESSEVDSCEAVPPETDYEEEAGELPSEDLGAKSCSFRHSATSDSVNDELWSESQAVETTDVPDTESEAEVPPCETDAVGIVLEELAEATPEETASVEEESDNLEENIHEEVEAEGVLVETLELAAEETPNVEKESDSPEENLPEEVEAEGVLVETLELAAEETPNVEKESDSPEENLPEEVEAEGVLVETLELAAEETPNVEKESDSPEENLSEELEAEGVLVETLELAAEETPNVEKESDSPEENLPEEVEAEGVLVETLELAAEETPNVEKESDSPEENLPEEVEAEGVLVETVELAAEETPNIEKESDSPEENLPEEVEGGLEETPGLELEEDASAERECDNLEIHPAETHADESNLEEAPQSTLEEHASIEEENDSPESLPEEDGNNEDNKDALEGETIEGQDQFTELHTSNEEDGVGDVSCCEELTESPLPTKEVPVSENVDQAETEDELSTKGNLDEHAQLEQENEQVVVPGEKNESVEQAEEATVDQNRRELRNAEGENSLLTVDRKAIVTRTRSLSGKVPGYVPETVPEEPGPDSDLQSPNEGPQEGALDNGSQVQGTEVSQAEANRVALSKPKRIILYPRSYSVEGREMPFSVYGEIDDSSFNDTQMKRKEDNLSLPLIGSSGSFSQRNHLSSSGVSTPSSVVDIPPPFELASITKKPITKSSPSLLIENESPDKYSKKKKSSFKRFLTLKFRKKTENKVHVDVNVSSSRSSSESSHHGPSRLLDLDRRSLGSSPQMKTRSGKVRASDSPSTFLFYKDCKRKGTPKTFSRSVSRVESFEDRSRPPFMPLPLTKPRSISFPNADTSDYENIPAMSSDYENIQIPPRRPTRTGTFTEFFEDPSRALSAANESDGYVDMSSFTAFESIQHSPEQETESAYTEPYKVCRISVVPTEDVTSDEEPEKSSGEEEKGQGETASDKQVTCSDSAQMTKGQSRSYYIAKELMSSEEEPQKKKKKLGISKFEKTRRKKKENTEEWLFRDTQIFFHLLLFPKDLREAVTKVASDDGEGGTEEESLSQILCELPAIYQLHQEIQNQLQGRISNWEEHPKIADVFLSRTTELSVYTTYIACFDNNTSLLDQCCQRSPHFAAILSQFQQSPGCGNAGVKHLLLWVVRRILQYRLFLTDYLNNLSPDSTEYEDTQAALMIVSELGDRVNDGMRQGENLQKLVHVEYSVRGHSHHFLQPGREFVKEGTLMKVSTRSKNPRHLFLMNDVLLYTYPQKNGKYRLKNTLAVAGLKISRPVLEKATNVLKIENAECCLTLSASSCSERDEWYSTLTRTIHDSCRIQSASGSDSTSEAKERAGICLGEKPPTLVPVSHVMMCMNCACDFTLTLRRHHCHACGKIVCRNCSRNKYPLKYLKDRLAKVCDQCFTELKRRELLPLRESVPPPSPKSTGSAFSSVFFGIHYSSLRKPKKIPSALKQVSASEEGASINGYLHRCRRGKRHWKKRWFVIKDKVLYTYAANEDKVATESLPLLGFTILPEKGGEVEPSSEFQLYHKKTLFYSFRAEDPAAARRWTEVMKEATVL
ncbi:FYVE, RhoGEF and PH domain-containing protein 5 [Latimeria chalumnae]|uniref:FYVE, RhoGEF and PH domain-containing protein 5 n=1 Tax=Latimeria chalumnae TaxID=7897 RepID=UPI00313C28C9